MLLRWQLLLSRSPLRQSVTGLTLRKAAWRKAQERAAESEKTLSSMTEKEEKEGERDKEGREVAGWRTRGEERSDGYRDEGVLLSPPFHPPVLLLAHHACTASLFGPRPVQDAARIAREGPAGRKGRIEFIWDLISRSIVRDSCADLIRDRCEGSLITLLIIERDLKMILRSGINARALSEKRILILINLIQASIFLFSCGRFYIFSAKVF